MIRTLVAGDAEEYLRMRMCLWPDCSAEMHRLEMDGQAKGVDTAVFVYERPDQKLGAFIELSVRSRVDGGMSPQVAYVEGWFVDPDLRLQGLGRELMKRAEGWAQERNLIELASDAEIWNEASIEAHGKLGFKETFRLVHFLKAVTPPIRDE